jgi:hypothetical protein
MAAANLPEPEREYLFHEQRKWRFDYAWVAEGIALEFEGGIWMKTKTGRSKGHAHPKRFLKDCEKYNEAALYGWRVLRVTTGAQIDTVFVPISGPWLKISESVDFVRAIAPRRALALHDCLLSDSGFAVTDANMAKLAGCDYARLGVGEAVTVG